MTMTLNPLFTWRSAIADSSLSPNTRHVALALSLHMNERGGSCFPGYETLRQETSRARATIAAAIRELEEEGFLIVERAAKGTGGPGRGRVNRYTAVIPETLRNHPPHEKVLRQDIPPHEKGPAQEKVLPQNLSSAGDEIKGSACEPEDVNLNPPQLKVVEGFEVEGRQGTPPFLLSKYLARFAKQFPKPWAKANITAERLLATGEVDGLSPIETAQALADAWDWWAHKATPAQRQKKDAIRFFRNWIRRDTRSSNGQENGVQEVEPQGRPYPVKDEALRAQVLALFVEREPDCEDPEKFVRYVMAVRPYETVEGWVELAQSDLRREARAK